MERIIEMPELTVAKKSGEEAGHCRDLQKMDMEIGDTNDFEAKISVKEWKKEKYWYGSRIFIPDSEYGGIIEDIESVTSMGTVVLRGATWRGMLARKVVVPPEGQDHLTVSGELNNILRELMGERFGSLFVVSGEDSGIIITSWQIDRYVTLRDAIDKLLENYGCRLKMRYVEPEELEYGYVQMQAMPITDYSEDLEYSTEGNVSVDIRDCRGGINHLICAGKGQNEERVILHLYVQEDGSIGKTQYYTGMDEREAVYEFSSGDLDKLEEDGTKRLKGLQNYKKCEMTVGDVDLELGDIVAGYDHVTDTQVKKPVIRKILKIQRGTTEIEYKVEGND